MRVLKDASNLSELTGWIIAGPISLQMKSALSKGILLRKHLLRAYYLGFD